jgi:hypothetical protein
MWSVTNEFDFNGGVLGGRHASDEATWVDPLVGAKFRADLGEDFYLSGWGVVGGFGIASDAMWDVMGGIGYEISDSFSVFGGDRAVSVDYSNVVSSMTSCSRSPFWRGCSASSDKAVWFLAC